MDALYRARDWFASLPSLLVVAAILMLSAQTVLPPKKEVVLTPIEISLTAPPEPEPPKPAPPEPPQPAPVKPAEPRPQPLAKPLVTPSQPAPPVEAAPSTSEPATVPATPSTPAPAKPAEAAPPAPAPAPRNTQSTENTYVGKVRAYLDSTKRYPTGREASSLRPRGATKVWFVLTRGGEATEAGIEESSGSMLLDNAALASVRRGRFAPFPDDAWPGQNTHRFTAELNFTPPE